MQTTHVTLSLWVTLKWYKEASKASLTQLFPKSFISTNYQYKNYCAILFYTLQNPTFIVHL